MPLLFAKVPRTKRQERILSLIKALHIEELKDRKVSKLSGGEKQRVAIARALANDPPLILADEPTGALDSATKAEILKILRDIHRQGKTILLVTHDPEVAAIADRVLHISDGVLTEVNRFEEHVR